MCYWLTILRNLNKGHTTLYGPLLHQKETSPMSSAQKDNHNKHINTPVTWLCLVSSNSAAFCGNLFVCGFVTREVVVMFSLRLVAQSSLSSHWVRRGTTQRSWVHIRVTPNGAVESKHKTCCFPYSSGCSCTNTSASVLWNLHNWKLTRRTESHLTRFTRSPAGCFWHKSSPGLFLYLMQLKVWGHELTWRFIQKFHPSFCLLTPAIRSDTNF